jgi:hypothetical protein
MSSKYYAERVTGAYPISIATSLAIEGALGVHPERPTGKDELSGHQALWINVKTVFRNFHNSMNKEDIPKCRPQEWAEELLREMEMIKQVISEVTRGSLEVIYYLPDYAGLEKEYPKAVPRLDTTPLQIEYTKRMRIVLGELLKLKAIEIKLYKFFIKDTDNRNVLMLTHVAIDLFTKTIRNKKLLESHTGAVKPRTLWYTKYHNGSTLMQIPFRLDMVQVFGDNELFRPQNPKIRQEVLQLAEKYHWSQVTTTDKIRYSINQLRDHALRHMLLDILED